jgi:ATPase family AAA domain-containing protein 2
MATRKRDLFDFDPNASDPEDEDYDNKAERSSRPSRRSRPSKGSSHRPAKRQRQRYNSSDIEDDELEVSEESWTNESEDDGPSELNPRTGRPLRRAAKTHATYEESDEDEIQDTVESSQEDELKPTPRKKNRNPKHKSTTPSQSLKVILKLRPNLLSSFATPHQSRSRAASATKSEMVHARRSSRLSHDLEEPTYQLTISGRHAEITKTASSSREQSVELVPITRQTRAGKGLAGKRPQKLPSAIMEASQETSQQTKPEPTGGEDDEKEEEEKEQEQAMQNSDPQIQPEIPESPGASPTGGEAGVIAGEDVEMEEAEPDDTAYDAEDNADERVDDGDEDEDEDEPVRPRGRNLRVSLRFIYLK